MQGKVKIDQEIGDLKNALDSIEDTHPDFMGKDLKDLQARVLSVHAHLEAVLETIILFQVMKEENELRFTFNRGLPISVATESVSTTRTNIKLMESISFKNKINIIKDFDNKIPEKSLSRVNKYRNEFAHPKGFDLSRKYNTTPKGKENIRDLLRCLIGSWKDMDNYILNNFPNLTVKELKTIKKT